MSVVKLFILSLTMVVLSFCSSKYMESPTTKAPFQKSEKFSNIGKPYTIYVPKNGQMMRLEVKGTAPMNGWQSFDMEVYSADNKYLFSYKDELWSESGYDSDGRWTEYKRHAYFDIRFPKKGDYLIYLTDSTNSKQTKAEFNFRAIPIRGSGKAFTPLLFVFGAILLVCFIMLAHRLESENSDISSFAKPQKPQPVTKKSKSWIWFYAGAFGLWGIAFSVASDDDDDEVYRNSSSYYLGHSHRHSQIYVDRSIRQQSLSGSNFRAGSSRGGK